MGMGLFMLISIQVRDISHCCQILAIRLRRHSYRGKVVAGNQRLAALSGTPGLNLSRVKVCTAGSLYIFIIRCSQTIFTFTNKGCPYTTKWALLRAHLLGVYMHILQKFVYVFHSINHGQIFTQDEEKFMPVFRLLQKKPVQQCLNIVVVIHGIIRSILGLGLSVLSGLAWCAAIQLIGLFLTQN